jgi:hypothetical protein
MGKCGVRNLIRSGVDQKTAMAISGHRTIATFQRYNITDEEDLARAIDRVSDHLAAQPQAPRKVVSLDDHRSLPAAFETEHPSTVQVESKFSAVR